MNQLIFKLAELSWPKVLLGGLFVTLAYFATMYDSGSTLTEETQSAIQQAQETEKLLKVTREKIANADRFEKEVQDLVEQFNRIVEYMPAKLSSADLTTVVADLAPKSGVRLLKTEPRTGTEKGEFYETSRLVFTVEGKFSEIVMFLSGISRVPRLMTFERAEIVTARASEDLESPKLTFSGTLVGYRYLAPKAPAVAGQSAAANPQK